MKKEIHIWSMLIAILSPIVGMIAAYFNCIGTSAYCAMIFFITLFIALTTADEKHFRSGGKIGPPGYPF